MQFRDRYHYDPQKDLIGKGGFAKVFKAKDQVRGTTVALKFYTGDGNEKFSLLSEIKKVINLEHPNICKYYDIAVLEGKNNIGELVQTEICIMEYMDGGDIKSYIKSHPDVLLKLLKDVLQGLTYLHSNNIIHRDLSPQNILIKTNHEGATAKITDFGISKLSDSTTTKSSNLVGKIEYMAPEQFNPEAYGISEKIATNLDLWSFGILTYELVTGQSLFKAGGQTSTEQVMRRILDGVDEEKLALVPQPYQKVIRTCLVKDAKARVKDASQLLSILEGNEVEKTRVISNSSMAKEPSPRVKEDIVVSRDLTDKKSSGFKMEYVIGITIIVLVFIVFIFNQSKNSSYSDSYDRSADSIAQPVNLNEGNIMEDDNIMVADTTKK